MIGVPADRDAAGPVSGYMPRIPPSGAPYLVLISTILEPKRTAEVNCHCAIVTFCGKTMTAWPLTEWRCIAIALGVLLSSRLALRLSNPQRR